MSRRLFWLAIRIFSWEVRCCCWPSSGARDRRGTVRGNGSDEVAIIINTGHDFNLMQILINHLQRLEHQIYLNIHTYTKFYHTNTRTHTYTNTCLHFVLTHTFMICIMTDYKNTTSILLHACKNTTLLHLFFPDRIMHRPVDHA